MNYALTFPGQGSQSVGMLSDLATAHSLVKQTFEEASDALDLDLWALSQKGPAEDLNRTVNTQPAMLTAGIAVSRVIDSQTENRPSQCAGHSLAEYTALCYAGAIGFADAVRLVAQRGQFMQEAVAEGVGSMAAILGLSDDKVAEACTQAAENEVVSPANFNATGQVVIAGHSAAVQRAVDAAKALGAKRAVILPVSVPAHCGLMESAATHLLTALEKIELQAPNLPVFHNVDVATHDDVADIRAVLAQQLHQPVRWVETIKALSDSGTKFMLEAGPGKVLTGLAKRIDKSVTVLPVYDLATLDKALAQIS
jgi:[acyl-carrier-protein] S-malonyltransferase